MSRVARVEQSENSFKFSLGKNIQLGNKRRGNSSGYSSKIKNEVDHKVYKLVQNNHDKHMSEFVLRSLFEEHEKIQKVKTAT